MLDFVAVPQQLEVLPRREQQDEDEQRGHADRLPELALPGLVHLADDRVVANVLLDGVFERFGHLWAFSAPTPTVRPPAAWRCAREGCGGLPRRSARSASW